MWGCRGLASWVVPGGSCLATTQYLQRGSKIAKCDSKQSPDGSVYESKGSGRSDALDFLNNVDTKEEDQKHSSVSGWKIGLGIASFIGIGACVAGPFMAPALRKYCLPFVPAEKSQLRTLMGAIEKHYFENSSRFQQNPSSGQNGRYGITDRSKLKLVDIGSGDGRVTIEAAKTLGVHAIGYELNPWLVYYSRYSALRQGAAASTEFHVKDLWKTDLSQFDVLTVFGVEEMMVDLEKKLSKEMKPDAVIFACRFQFPTWQPFFETVDRKGKMGTDSVWAYRRQ
eukprot:Nk52_evm34s217 gene=Nk52_evmTU34s217